MKTPLVTIVVPCLNEETHIERCVRSIQAQTYPREDVEILVADGGSTDGTRRVLERLVAEDQRIRLLDNPRRIQAAGLNLAILAARGEIIVRMDVHADYAPSYLHKCIDVLRRTGADNVGGPARCRSTSGVQRAVCAALHSPLGFGGAAFRDPDAEGFVDTLFPGAFRREVFDRVGLFDEGAVTNEDAELNQRILQAGGRIYLSRDIIVHYYPRDTLAGLARQYFRYGSGRARTLVKHRRLPTPRPVLPALGLVLGTGLLAAAPRAAMAVAALYSLVVGVEAARLARAHSASALLTGLVFPIMHVPHGLGFVVGLARYLMRRDWR